MPVSPLFRFLSRFQVDDLQGKLEAIFIAPGAGTPMQLVPRVDAIPDAGLSGDRYALDAGHWQATDGCQVTLVSLEAITRAEQGEKQSLPVGWHRRNLVVSGIDMDAIRRHDVRIGTARFTFHRLRPPCAYLDRVSGDGAGRALRRAGGIGLRVKEGGTLNVGDVVRLVETNRARQSR